MRDRTERSLRVAVRDLRIAVTSLIVTGLLAACGSVTPTAGIDPDLDIELLVIARSAGNADDSVALHGSSLVGTVQVLVRPRDPVDVVRFYVDDEATAGDPTHVATTDPFVYDVDTTQWSDGAHTLTAVTSTADGVERAATARFVVMNGSSYALPAPTLFVSTNGDDASDGRAVDRPLRSVQRAADLAQPGDVVYVRGGIYPIRVTFHRSGTAGDPIVWASYPGERAVFDGSSETPVESSAAFRVHASWNVFVGFDVRHGPVEGIFVKDAHDNVFRDIVSHGHHYSGVTIYRSDRNLLERIVAYDNFDRFNPRGLIGDDADGISLSSGDGNVLRHVVAYANSDDGIDAWKSTNTLIEFAIVFDNGRGEYGNGNGIKAGGASSANRTIVRHSIAFDNRAHGFDDNSGQYVSYAHNTAFGNGGYAFVAGPTTTLRNNLAATGVAGLWGADSAHNSWDLGITSFGLVSTDRDDAGFLTLAAGSPAVDAGVDVGLGYSGVAPDLGALAYGTAFVDVLAPVQAVLDAHAASSGALLASR